MIYLKLFKGEGLIISNIDKDNFSSGDLDLFVTYENNNLNRNHTYIHYIGKQGDSSLIFEIIDNKLIAISIKCFFGEVKCFDSPYTELELKESNLYPFTIDLNSSNVDSKIQLNNISVYKDFSMNFFNNTLEILIGQEIPTGVIRLSSSLALYLNDENQLVGFYLHSKSDSKRLSNHYCPVRTTDISILS